MPVPPSPPLPPDAMSAPIPDQASALSIEARQRLARALDVLAEHHRSFAAAKPFADETKQAVPSDTKNWSQILVSELTGTMGLAGEKGPDLADNSDVKAANVWEAIDTPRFNGCLPAGRTSAKAKKALDLTALDSIPKLFFVLWDRTPGEQQRRCRIWVARTDTDPEFRRVAGKWYQAVRDKTIKSTNFQLQPPRNRDSNVFNNKCGNLEYPLYFAAVHDGAAYHVTHFDPTVLTSGECRPAAPAPRVSRPRTRRESLASKPRSGARRRPRGPSGDTEL